MMKVSPLFATAGAVLAMSLALGAAANASTVSLQTTPAAAAALYPGQQVATFDAAASGAYGTYSEAGVTFTTDSGTEYIDSAYIGSYNNFGVNSLHNCYCGNSFGTLTMTFASPVTGIGFFWGASDNQWTLSAYNASHSLIESFDLPITHGSNAGDFVGIMDPGIAYAVLSGPSSDYVFVDNVEGTLTGGVPEPAAWAMILLGVGGVGAALRARRPRFAAA